jgi:ABC-2 type transport system ATP-binding protein
MGWLDGCAEEEVAQVWFVSRRRMATESFAVEAVNLKKTYPGDIHAVKGVSFQVAAGEAFGLLGPNGAGKTTTIGMLNTTVMPSSGRAFLGGRDVANDPLGTRAISSVVFQGSVVDMPLTGRQNLELHLKLWDSKDGWNRANELCDVAEIRDILERPVSTYSGGQRRRLEIVRALSSSPQILFLDEPTVGLDTRIRHDLFDALATLRDRTGVTIMITTHYLDEAERLCDRVAIIDAGRLVACDTPARLLEAMGEEVVDIRVDAPNPAVQTLLHAAVSQDDLLVVGSTLTVSIRDGSSERLVQHLRERGIVVRSVTTRRPTLDDVYLKLTGDRIGASEQ